MRYADTNVPFDDIISHLPESKQQMARQIIRDCGDGDTGPISRLLLVAQLQDDCVKMRMKTFLGISGEHIQFLRNYQKTLEKLAGEIGTALNTADAQISPATRQAPQAASAPVPKKGNRILEAIRKLPHFQELAISGMLLILMTFMLWLVSSPPADYKRIKEYEKMHILLHESSTILNVITDDSGKTILQVRGRRLVKGKILVKDDNGDIIGFDMALEK